MSSIFHYYNNEWHFLITVPFADLDSWLKNAPPGLDIEVITW